MAQIKRMTWKTGLLQTYPNNHGEALWEQCSRITYQFLYFKSSNDIYPVLVALSCTNWVYTGSQQVAGFSDCHAACADAAFIRLRKH